MASILVSGGRKIVGTARVSGAKNAALPILAATLIARGPVELTDCPHLSDVENMLKILRSLGVSCSLEAGTAHIDAAKAERCIMPQSISKEIRSSIFMLGPLLGRFGRAVCTFPGGCEIGHRPIDLHLKGLMMLGAEGTTTVFNAAREPEIDDLARFLNELGYKIEGAGSSTITIRGGDAAEKKTTHRIIPDRIVAGTLMTAAAITGGELTLTNVNTEHIGSIAAKLKEAGSVITAGEGMLHISSPDRPNEIRLTETMPYPGFPTDMQAQLFALCTIAIGTSVIVENVFENRYRHAAELGRMGASFTQKDRTAIIRGVDKLTGARVKAWDLRGGAAMLLAGLAAEGETIIDHAELIDRGYDKLHETLNALGAQIIRKEN